MDPNMTGPRGPAPGGAAIDTFLAALPADLRAPLQQLREQIAVACPEAVETIAYGVPAFRYHGRPLVSFSAGRTGRGPCALYVQSPPLVEALRDDLAGFDTGKGTIHFGPDRPLRAALVEKIVRARMAETDAPRARTPRAP